MPPGLIAAADLPPPEVWQTLTVGDDYDYYADSNLYGYATIGAAAYYFGTTAFGTLSPTLSEVGVAIEGAAFSPDGYFYLILSGNVTAGSLRFHVGANSVQLSTLSRYVNEGYTIFIHSDPPSWLRFSYPGTRLIRLSAT